MARLFFEDFKPGEVITYGDRLVTEQEIVDFARQYDPQDFHLDPEAGKRSLLRGLAASGWHSACILMRMNCDAFIFEMAGLGSPGIEELKWIAPVRPGDRLRARRTIMGARVSGKRPEMGFVDFLFELLNQNGEAVLSQRNVIMIARRGMAAPVLSYDAPGQVVGDLGAGAPAPCGACWDDVVEGEWRDLGKAEFTAADIIAFAKDWDPQPFHLSEEGGANSPFGRLAASGWQTGARWMRALVDTRKRLAAEAAESGEAAAVFGPSPGFTHLRWAKPVYAGDVVSYGTKVTGKRATSKPGWGLIFSENTGVNRKGELVFAFRSAAFLRMRG